MLDEDCLTRPGIWTRYRAGWEVVIFDSDVLIGFLNRDNTHHSDAVAQVRAALRTRHRALAVRGQLCGDASSVLSAPARRSASSRCWCSSTSRIHVDMELTEHATSVRARTNLKLPDAFALATAIHAEHRGHPASRWPASTMPFARRTRACTRSISDVRQLGRRPRPASPSRMSGLWARTGRVVGRPKRGWPLMILCMTSDGWADAGGEVHRAR